MRSILAIVGLLCCLMAEAQTIRVMSYNIRYDNPGDGVNAWPNRTDKVVVLIQKYNPDIIGLQEALHHQLQDLLRVLPEYTMVGVGRDDGGTKGEFSAILYKHSRFGVLSRGTFWLSETPDEAGSKSWDAALPRIATWARLFDKESKAEFFFLNTHFDHVGKLARTNSAQLIKNKLTELSQKMSVIISGDFNCTPEEEPYHEMIAETDPVLFDSNQRNPVGTYCGFEINQVECRPIDFIFHSKEWIVNMHHVITDNDGKYYPSDHLPVLAELFLAHPK